jgi:hypothetical protein
MSKHAIMWEDVSRGPRVAPADASGYDDIPVAFGQCGKSDANVIVVMLDDLDLASNHSIVLHWTNNITGSGMVLKPETKRPATTSLAKRYLIPPISGQHRCFHTSSYPPCINATLIDAMPSDDDLLARLNALKKSSVSFDTTYSSSVAASQPPKPTDDLATRFARLGSASPSSSPQPTRKTSSSDARASIVAPGEPSFLQSVADGIGGSNIEFNEEDEKSLEELLGELKETVGDKTEWDLSGKEQQDVGRLLKDMKRILPEVVNSRAQDSNARSSDRLQAPKEELTDWESIEINIGSGALATGALATGAGEDGDEEHGEDGADKKQTEDEEADDLIARVMAELEISKKYDPPSPPPEDNHSDSGEHKKDEGGDVGLALPSAPTELPEDDFERTKAIEDAFTARLAALSAPSPSQTDSLGLPSAPSFSPHKKPPIGSIFQKRIDDEIDTWCIICQDDATLKCLGCDGDLYCQLCWTEGHRGESAGFDEKTHKVVLYAKRKKQAAS